MPGQAGPHLPAPPAPPFPMALGSSYAGDMWHRAEKLGCVGRRQLSGLSSGVTGCSQSWLGHRPPVQVDAGTGGDVQPQR